MANFRNVKFFSLVLALVFSLKAFSSLLAGTAINNRTSIEYTDLQQAIDDAQSGDTLNLSGTFTGSFHIFSKSLALKGEEVHSTILDGNNQGRVLEIMGPSSTDRSEVTLESLTIQNGIASGKSNNGETVEVFSVYM